MQVDAAEGCELLQKGEAISCKYLGSRVRILPLTREMEARDDTGVLIEAGTLWKSTQCSLNRPDPRIEFQVGQALFIDSREREKAAVAPSFQRESRGADEARDWDDAARGSGLCEPRGESELLSVCAGHSSSSG